MDDLLGGGVVYLVLWIYGLVIDQGGSANFVPINTADNWLHFVLGIALLGLGFLTKMLQALLVVPAARGSVENAPTVALIDISLSLSTISIGVR